MEHNRLGVMGHYYGGMLDIYSDLTQQVAHFGGHIEIVEVDELAALRDGVSAPEIVERVEQFHSDFDVQADCSQAELERAARTSVALDTLAAQHQLGSMAYYYMGVGNPANEDAISSIILGNSLLTAGHSGCGRVGNQERTGDENHGFVRRWGFVHRILRDGFQG